MPKVFGRLLYGSKFHRLRQSRGQQGIGISAAGMYGLLTTGKPIAIITRTGAKKPRHSTSELVIDTRSNEPQVKHEAEIDWDRDHGTRVEIELEGTYRGGQHSVDTYIRQISLANPHAQITYVPPKAEEHGAEHVFPRVSDELPPETARDQAAPLRRRARRADADVPRHHGAQPVGLPAERLLARLAGASPTRSARRAKVAPTRRPSEIEREEAEALHRAIQATKIMAPPTTASRRSARRCSSARSRPR